MSTTDTTPAHQVRPGLPPLPARIARLPVDARGYPVPFFVQWFDGVPDFRVVDERKFHEALGRRLCFVCGELLGVHMAFVIGPMCAVNRLSVEPPVHRECAEWSACACPFLTRPHMRRREGGMPEEAVPAPGNMIKRNPGVALVWVTKTFHRVRIPAHPGGVPGIGFRLGDPHHVAAYAQGRPATPEELREAVDSGLPLLQAEADAQGSHAVRALAGEIHRARALLGIAGPG